tara:strand:- start:11032 stop:14883 length:3852 start_codon:yes stop_codon:yes gene_type:complete
MATKNIVPRANGEGTLGSSSKLWKEVHHVTSSFGDTKLIEDASNNLQLSGGPLVAASGLSGSLTQLSDGSSYIKQGSNVTVTSASNGAITIASTDTNTTYSAGSGLALSSTTFSARSSVTVTVAGGKFVIDGTSQQTLSLAKGVVYYFDQSDNTNNTHPLRFSTTSDGSHGGGSEYTTGRTTGGTPGNAGAYTQIILEQDAPSVLYYYCTGHSGMGGKVETAPDALLTGNRTFANNLTVTGDLTVNGTTTTVNTDNLIVEDPVVLLGSGASSANTNGGLALLSGSSVANNSLVIGRVANDTWGVGRKDVTGGSVTTLADMTLVDFKAAGITASSLTLDSTAVTSTAAELNLLDGGTSVGSSITISDSDGFIVNDAGTMKTIPASDLKTYTGGGASAADDITVGDAEVNLSTTSGNVILSGSAIVLTGTNGVQIQGDVIPTAAGAYDLGSTSAEYQNLYLSDSGKIIFGNDQNFQLNRHSDTQLQLNMDSATSEAPVFGLKSNWAGGVGPQLVFWHDSSSPTANDVIGRIQYYGDDAGGVATIYSEFDAKIISTTAGDERGGFDFKVLADNTETVALAIEGTATAGIATVDLPDHNGATGGLKLGGTLVTSTAAELNLLDGGTSVGSSITIADSDGFIVNDNGTMKTIPASDLSTYVGGGGGMSDLVDDTSPQLGGTLDINSNRIQGSLLPSAADTYHLGSATYEWKDVYLSDLSKVYFGADQDIYLARYNNTTMQVKLPSAASGGPTFQITGESDGTQGPNLKLHHNSSSPAANDVLGNLRFAGEASNSTETNYGIVTGEIVDPTAGSERGSVIVSVEANSQNTEALKIVGGTSTGESTVDIADHDGSAGGLKLGGTLVTSTATELNKLDGATITTTELNLLDGGTDVGSPTTTIADADRFIINDNGTMTHVSASVLKTYIGAGAADDITTGDAAVTIATSAGNITLDAQGNDTDIIFKGTDGSSDTTFLTLDGSEAGAAAFNSNVTVGGDLEVNGDTSTFSSANASDPLVIIKNTTNDAAGARLRFVKDKGAAGADNDVAGLIEFYADDDNQDNILFAKVEAAVADASNGAEGGKLTLSIATHDGEIQPGLVLTDGSAEDEVDVTIGNGADSVTTVAGDAKVTGDIILDDGGSLKEAGGTAAFTFDGDGHVTKIGQDSPSSGQFLKWDGSKAVWDAASGGSGGGGKHELTKTTGSNFTIPAFAGSTKERQLYIVNSSNAVTATLPNPGATTYDGYEINIKRLGTGIVHITGSVNIDNSHTFDLPSQFSNITLVATGSQYVII